MNKLSAERFECRERLLARQASKGVGTHFIPVESWMAVCANTCFVRQFRVQSVQGLAKPCMEYLVWHADGSGAPKNSLVRLLHNPLI